MFLPLLSRFIPAVTEGGCRVYNGVTAVCGIGGDPMLIIQKFGGSSLADLEKLRRAAELCLDARRRGHDIVAVVSPIR